MKEFLTVFRKFYTSNSCAQVNNQCHCCHFWLCMHSLWEYSDELGRFDLGAVNKPEILNMRGDKSCQYVICQQLGIKSDKNVQKILCHGTEKKTERMNK